MNGNFSSSLVLILEPKFIGAPKVPFSKIATSYKSNPPAPPGIFEEKYNFLPSFETNGVSIEYWSSINFNSVILVQYLSDLISKSAVYNL